MIQKILKVADKKKSEINIKLKSILLLSSHTNKNKSVGFANIAEQKLFCSNNEPNFPNPPAKTIPMSTTSNDRNMSIRNLLFSDMRWRFGVKKVKAKLTNQITGKVRTKSICMAIQKVVKPTITSNHYSGIEQDKLVQYGNYKQPWKLDSGASGHFCGKQTGVRNRRNKKHGTNLQVADGKTITQVEEGSAPFNKLPGDPADVQIFPIMPNLLMSAGKIVKKGHKIILDDPVATVINKKTNEVVMEATFDHRTSKWNIYPNGPVDYEFKKEQKVNSLGLGVQEQQQQGKYVIHLASNAYRLNTKKEIIEYYHAAAGWPVKKTWI